MKIVTLVAHMTVSSQSPGIMNREAQHRKEEKNCLHLAAWRDAHREGSAAMRRKIRAASKIRLPPCSQAGFKRPVARVCMTVFCEGNQRMGVLARWLRIATWTGSSSGPGRFTKCLGPRVDSGGKKNMKSSFGHYAQPPD